MGRRRRRPTSSSVQAVTEPPREDDLPLERQTREAAKGQSARTPLLLIGGVGGTIAAVVAILAVAMLLIWRFA